MKKAIALFLVLALLCGLFTLAVSAEDEAWKMKIDQQILDRMEKPGENIGVWMWFTDIDQEELERRVAGATGYTESEYEAKKHAMPQTTEEEKKALNDFISSYRRARNSVMSEMYEAHNGAIIAQLGLSDIRMLSTATNSAIVNIPKDKVYAVAQNPSVLYLYYHRLQAELPEHAEGGDYRFADQFLRYIGERSSATYVPEIWSYEELFYHKAADGKTDWVLLDAQVGGAELWMGFGIVGNRVLMMGPLEVFRFGMGLYDVKNDTFIDLTDQKDLSAYDGLEEAIDLYGKGRLLGDLDVDGEITIFDVTLLSRCEADITDYPDSDRIDSCEYIDASFRPLTYYSDFNRDGERDITDATCVQRYLAGLPYPKYR